MANVVKAKMNRLAAEQPRPKVKVKKGDRVLITSGSYRGDVGRVVEVEPVKGWARVEGVNMIKKHEKPDRQKGKRGGVVEMEAPINLSNMKVLCPTCGKPTRVGRTVLGDGKIARVCKREGCGATFESKTRGEKA